MIEYRNKNRILAFVMAVLLVIGMMPVYVVKGETDETEPEVKEYHIMFTVKDENGLSVSGADITYNIMLAGEDSTTPVVKGSIQTADNGTATVTVKDTEDVLSSVSEDNKAYLNYYVGRNGEDITYASIYNTEEISSIESENTYNVPDIELKEGIALSITSEHGSVKVNNVPVALDGATYTGTAYVVKGEDADITIDTEAGYKLGEVVSTSGDVTLADGVYTLNVADENIAVNVKYIKTFNIKVAENGSLNGTVKFCEQEVIEGTNIDFTDTKYKDELSDTSGTVYVVIKPEDGYRAAKISIKKDNSEQPDIESLSETGDKVYKIENIDDNIQVYVEYAFLHTVTIDSTLTSDNVNMIEFVDKNGNVMTDTTSCENIDEGEKIKIKVTPQTGYHVEEIYINGEAVEEDISGFTHDNVNQDIIMGEITIKGTIMDINITADFAINVYTVSCNILGGSGEIKIDDKPFEENSTIINVEHGKYKVTVTAQTKDDTTSEDYRIQSIKIGEKGADFSTITEETILNNKEWTKDDVQINKNTEIQVTFVRVYTATITYNKNEGTVTTSFQNEESSSENENEETGIKTINAVLNKDGTMTVEVNAIDNSDSSQNNTEKYAINSINVNDINVETVSIGKFNADRTTWNGEFTADEDYSIEIVFIKYGYTVKSVENIVGGTIKISPSKENNEFEIGESAEVTITANKGQNISDIKINRESITAIASPTDRGTTIDGVQRDGDSIKFIIRNIKENIEISAEFMDIPVSASAEFGKNVIISDSLNIITSNNLDTYVYSETTDIRLYTNVSTGIRAYGYKTDSTDIQILGGDYTTQSIDIVNNTVITEIQIFNSAENGGIGQWEKVTIPKNIKMVYDCASAEVKFYAGDSEITEETPIYNENITVKISVDENTEEAYSGIKSIEYAVVSDYTLGMEANRDSLEFETETIGNDEAKVKSFSIGINAEEFNSSNTAIIVYAEDNAGNMTIAVQKLDIDKTAPTVTVEYKDITVSNDGTDIDDSDVNYNDRKAVITVTERNVHFDASNITITVKKNGAEYNYGKLDWTHSNTTLDSTNDSDYHTVIIEFTDDANYELIVQKVQDTAGNIAEIGTYTSTFTVDKKAPEVNVSIADANDTGIYNDSVLINLSSNDATSNISRVTYTIKAGDTESAPININVGDRKNWEEQLKIDKAQYNEDNITVSLTAEDVCGRKSETSYVTFSIDIITPVITITGIEDGSYYQRGQTATVTIQERSSHFDKDNVEISISTSKVNNSGDYNVSGIWKTAEGDTPDEAIHQTTVTFTPDAVYTISIAYTDDAGNVAKTVAKTFTIDGTKPTGSISSNGYSWTKNLAVTNKSVVLTHSSSDITSGIFSADYYKSNSTKVLTSTELDNLEESKWQSLNGNIAITDNDHCVVYMRVTDKAGNIFYTSTSGIIVDTKAPSETVEPSVTVTPEQPVNGIYNKNVNVAVSVTDPEAGGTFSGIKNVTYNVYNMGTVTQNGTLYSFNNDNPTEADLKQSFKGTITVDAALNNSNDVVIEVTATDNAGNSFTRTASIKIDTTKPSIDISYDNNSPDSTSYYRTDRTATITITERNFRADDVEVIITNTDGTIPSLSGWTKTQGTGNGDDTAYTSTVTYNADGDYTFAIGYSDLAGNESTTAVFEDGTQNPIEFTIDKTLPVVEVQTKDGTSNGAYIQDSREVTITITEHNFTSDRAVLAVNGATVNVQWSSSGDTHTASYLFTDEGEYQGFTVTVSDMAGNEGETQTLDTFYIDTQQPDLNVVVESEENKGYIDNYAADENGNKIDRRIYVFRDGNITISYADTYYEEKSIRLTKTRYGNSPEEVDVLKLDGVNDNGSAITIPLSAFENSQENDGLYQLDINVTDMSGRETPQTIYFTINRFGSVYIYNNAIMEIQNKYRQEVTENFVITEYNADKLEGTAEITVTKDGTRLTLVEGTDYTIAPENKSVGWYKYIYTINKEVFSADGVYKLSVTSKDAAGNNPETISANTILDDTSSIVSDRDIVFYIDTTKPEITSINGMDEAIFNENEHQVTFTVFDAIGLSDEEDAVVVEINGEKAEVSLTAGENDSINRTYAFTMTEGTNQSVVISVTDKALNTRSTNDDDFNPGYAFESEITVSTNFFIRWYANKPIFFGSIGGTIAVAGGGAAAFVIRRRKLKLKADSAK